MQTLATCWQFLTAPEEEIRPPDRPRHSSHQLSIKASPSAPYWTPPKHIPVQAEHTKRSGLERHTDYEQVARKTRQQQ